MTGAAIGGYKFADGFGDQAANFVNDVRSDIDAYQQGADLEEYREKQIQKNIEEARNNIELQNKLAERTGGWEQARDAMDKIGDDCIIYGLSDARDIATAYELINSGYDSKDALKYVKATKDYGKNTSELGHNDRTEFLKTVNDRVRKQMPSDATEKDIQETIDTVVSEFDKTSKILYKN